MLGPFTRGAKRVIILSRGFGGHLFSFIRSPGGTGFLEFGWNCVGIIRPGDGIKTQGLRLLYSR